MIDAEEADRLELSPDVIAATWRDPSLKGRDEFGVVVQAYQKRCDDAIGWIADLAHGLGLGLSYYPPAYRYRHWHHRRHHHW